MSRVGERAWIYWISKSACASWEGSLQSINPGNGEYDALVFLNFTSGLNCSIMARLETTS